MVVAVEVVVMVVVMLVLLRISDGSDGQIRGGVLCVVCMCDWACWTVDRPIA